MGGNTEIDVNHSICPVERFYFLDGEYVSGRDKRGLNLDIRSRFCLKTKKGPRRGLNTNNKR